MGFVKESDLQTKCQRFRQVPEIRLSQPLRVPRPRNPREPKPRRSLGERLRLRISSTTMFSWIRRDLIKLPRRCQRFSASPVASCVKSSKLMDLLLELLSRNSPTEEKSSVLETLIPSSIYSQEPRPRVPNKRLRKKLPLPPARRSETARATTRRIRDLSLRVR